MPKYQCFIALAVLWGGLIAPRAHAQSENPDEQSCGIQLAGPQSEFLVVDAEGEVVFRMDNRSGSSELALAQHLADTGAVVYTAFWCPHCHTQLSLFGVEAIASLNVIECDPEGRHAQPALCRQKFQQREAETGQQSGYPTWEIKGQFYSGVHTLAELAHLSGYANPQEFVLPPQTHEGERGIPGRVQPGFLHLFQLRP